MRRILPVLIFMLLNATALAQWRHDAGDTTGNGLGSYFAFGVHNGILFNSDPYGVWRHYDTGIHPWVEADSGIDFSQTGIVTNFASLGPCFFAGIFYTDNKANGPAYLSTNDGKSWKIAIAGPVASNGKYLFAEYYDYIARSTDNGNKWDSIEHFSLNTWATDSACILASASDGIYRSTDNGTNWTKTTPPVGLSLSAFAIISTQIFAGGAGVFRSADSGHNWTRITIPPLGYTLYPYKLPGAVNALASYKTYLFAGTDTGVFVSSDSGGSWRNVSQGLGGGNHTWSLGFPAVKLLAVVDTMLFAGVYTGTDATGNLYGYDAKRSIPEMIADTTRSLVQTVPSSDSIEIYPNPATGMVTILAGGTSMLGVSVLNILGEEVLDVPDARQSEITFDLSKLPSGTYFVRIQTAEGNALRKIEKE